MNIRHIPCIDVSQVLNTVFWLGKAASGCASYSGPTLNLKEFEGLLAQMKMVSEHSEEDRAGRGRRGRKTDNGVVVVWGMDLLVSCLCWGAGETHEAGNTFLFLLYHSYSYFRERQKRGAGYDLRKKIGSAHFIYWINWKFIQTVYFYCLGFLGKTVSFAFSLLFNQLLNPCIVL